jgi:hypothetical protein
MRASLKHKQKEKEELKERVLQVAEQYNLQVQQELDEVGLKYLGTYVNAQASKAGSKFRIDFDSTNFFKMEEQRQRRTILHELIHIKQFNNSLSNWAKEEFNVSDEVSEKLDGTIWEDVRSVEGETELLLSKFFPNQESTYPYAEKRKEKEFNEIDLEKELGINEEQHSIYREIEDITVEENIYIEQGQINGEKYEVTVIGDYTDDEAFEKVTDYLQPETNYEIEPEIQTGEYTPMTGLT